MTMSVSFRHPGYDRRRFGWRTVRDCIEGSSAVKRANTVYLPMPSGMSSMTTSYQVGRFNGNGGDMLAFDGRPDGQNDYFRLYDPSHHVNPVYEAYKKRSRFPGVTSFLLRGLLGLATMRPNVYKLDPKMAINEDFLTRDGKTMETLYHWLLSQSIEVGRSLMLLDVDPNSNQLYIASYNTESIINWRTTNIDGVRVPTMIVIEEWVQDPTSTEDFSHDVIPRHRVLKIQDGIYQVDIYLNDVFQHTVIPELMGQQLTFIPGVVTGSSTLGLQPDVAPMLSVAEIAVQIYQKNADLSQAEFLTCNPTLHYTGVGEDETPGVVGSAVAVSLPNPEAQAFYPTTDTAALSHVRDHMTELYNEAMQFGMSMLNTKKMAESAEALRLRQTATGATLSEIVDTAEAGMRMIFDMATIWSGGMPGKTKFDADKSFANVSMTAAERQALLQAWMGGAISWDSYADKMRADGSIPADITNAQELKRIEKNPPPVKAVNEPGVTGKLGNDSQVSQNPTNATGGE